MNSGVSRFEILADLDDHGNNLVKVNKEINQSLKDYMTYGEDSVRGNSGNKSIRKNMVTNLDGLEGDQNMDLGLGNISPMIWGPMTDGPTIQKAYNSITFVKDKTNEVMEIP